MIQPRPRKFICLLVLWVLPVCSLWGGTTRQSSQESTEEKETDKGLPLKPTWKLDFETEEVTWLSLDVSPDGQKLILGILGDLYTLGTAGGTATRLTSGLGLDTQPVYSPDGSHIAFISDRDGSENLWIMDADAKNPKKLSDDKQGLFASPTWTPDGQYVMVSRSTWGLGTYEIWSYHIQGGSGIQITKAKSADNTPQDRRHNALGVCASPDGRFIYYARRLGGFSYNADFPMWQVARRDLRTGDEDVLTQESGSGFRPVLSPDGSRLVYGTRLAGETALRIRDLATGVDRQLVHPVQRDDQESRFTRDVFPGYDFSPDGRYLFTTHQGKILRVEIASSETTNVPLSAAVSLDMGPALQFPRRVEEGPLRIRLIQDPEQSPDGKKLAFSSLENIYVMDLPEGPLRRLTEADGREFQPAWSADGRWIAYVTWSNQGGHIWKAQADGNGAPQQLTRISAFYSDVAWSPDGSRLVALRAPAHERVVSASPSGQLPGHDLIWLPVEGGDANLIIPSRGAGKPHFTDETDRVYVYSNDGLLSLRFDGTDRRIHLKVTGKGSYSADQPVPARDVRISRDGKWALAHAQNQLYVLAVPHFGGEAPTVNVDKSPVPIKRLTDVGADFFAWSRDGETITWGVGSSFLRQPFDSVRFDEPKDEPEADQPRTFRESQAEEIEVRLEVEREVPEGSILLRGATVITMQGDEVIPNADVVVTRNRISAVGARGAVDVPSDAQVRDVSGLFIVPGFIDTHAHWRALRGGILDVENWSFLANLAYGVTSGLDVQTSTNDMFAYQDLVDAGKMLGLRAFSTGPGIFSDNDFKSKEQAAGVLSKYKDYYRTRNLKSYLAGNRRQRQFIVQAAQEQEMMPTTEGALDLKLDMTHAIDGFSGNEHSLPIVPLFKDVVELFARSKTAYTPTLLVAYGGPWAETHFFTTYDAYNDQKLNRFVPRNVIESRTRKLDWFREDAHIYKGLAEQAAKIMRAGGLVGVGSHGQLQGLGYHWELWALQSGGLSNLEALQAATLNGARIIGLGQDLGSIENGKLADLVILEKNPLEDIRNTNTIRFVMKNGELYEGDTLNRVLPSKEELEPLWWWPSGGR